MYSTPYKRRQQEPPRDIAQHSNYQQQSTSSNEEVVLCPDFVPQSLLIQLPNMSPFPNRPQSWNNVSSQHNHHQLNSSTHPPTPSYHPPPYPPFKPYAHLPVYIVPCKPEPKFVNTVEAVIQHNQKLAQDALEAIRNKRELALRRRNRTLTDQGMRHQIQSSIALPLKVAAQNRQVIEQEMHHEIQKSITTQSRSNNGKTGQSDVQKRLEVQVKLEEQPRGPLFPQIKPDHPSFLQAVSHIPEKTDTQVRSSSSPPLEVRTNGTASHVRTEEQVKPTTLQVKTGTQSNGITTQTKSEPPKQCISSTVPKSSHHANLASADLVSARKTVPHPKIVPECMHVIKLMKTKINPEMQQEPNKRHAVQVRKLINTTIGQLNNTRVKINQVFIKIDKQLKESQGDGATYYAYTLNQLSKKICRQAEAELRPDPTKAYAYGQIAVLLMTRHRDLETYLLARMYKFCPYLIPSFYTCETRPEVLKRLLRYKSGERGEQYIERMTTHVALFAAILQTTPIIGQLCNPLDLSMGWTWLARVLNHSPTPLMAYLIETFMVIAGNAFLGKYLRQGQKIMHLLVSRYLPTCGVEVNSITVRMGSYQKPNGKYDIPVSTNRDPQIK